MLVLNIRLDVQGGTGGRVVLDSDIFAQRKSLHQEIRWEGPCKKAEIEQT